MAAGKNRPDTPPGERSLREGAEEQLARVPKHSPELKGKTSEQFIHELQVHQIELVTQAEELRRAHLALEESRDKFLDLYDFAPTGYLTLTDKVLIAEVNLAGATLLGVERSKLVNKRFRKFIAPEFLEQWDRYFINVLNHGEKQICTLTLKRGDGSVFPARLEGIRIPGSSATITVRIAIIDITDIWQIEALKESEERFRTLFEQSNDAIFIADPKTRMITDCNRKAELLTGHSQAELLTLKMDALHPKDVRAETIDNFRKYADGMDVSVDSVVITRDGRRVPVSIIGNQIEVNGQNFLIGSFRDISRQKQAEEALQKVYDTLETDVKERTAELFSANMQLQKEVLLPI